MNPVILACLLLAPAAAAAVPPEGMRLLWSDEFDGDGAPDPKKWTFEEGFVRNDEAQWYHSDNASRSGGLLRFEARRERVRNAQYEPKSRDWRRNRPFAEYTSALVTTAGKFSWQYGVMEVRGRFDARGGLWPAIWTVGRRPAWPECGEVDLMEYYDGALLANACWRKPNARPGAGPQWDATKVPLTELGTSDWADEFHVWRMVWTRERIALSVDDRVLNEIDLDGVPTSEDGHHPFRQPHHILLNLAVGGDKGGDPSRTEFPAKFDVDYVRVYQPVAP